MWSNILSKPGKLIPGGFPQWVTANPSRFIPNDNPDNRGKNRRVEIILEMMDS